MDLRWQAATGPAGSGPRVALVVGSVEVARMMDRVDGTWFALLRYPGRKAVSRNCTNFEAGRAGCEAWARRHCFVLEAFSERRRLEWLGRQTWRGADAMRARERLAALEAPAASASLQRPARLDCKRAGERGQPRGVAVDDPSPASTHRALLVA